MKVGFIGLGHMGAAMAANLMRAGHDVSVFNRSPGKSGALVKLGAREAANVAGVCDGDAVMLEKRPPSGIWGGLWSLPEAADEAALEARAREFGGDGAVSPLAPLTHTFTHFRLDIEPRLAELGRAAGGSAALGDAETVWVALRDIDAYGVGKRRRPALQHRLKRRKRSVRACAKPRQCTE